MPSNSVFQLLSCFGSVSWNDSEHSFLGQIAGSQDSRVIRGSCCFGRRASLILARSGFGDWADFQSFDR
jgi:hypothetical protein